MPISTFLALSNPKSAGEPTLPGTSSTDTFAAGLPGVTVVSVSSFSFGASNATTAGSATSGAGASKVTFGNFQVTRAPDKNSPALFTALCAGQHFATVQLYVRMDAKPNSAYLCYEMQTVFVTDLELSGETGGDITQESISFTFASLVIGYRGTNKTGALDPPIKAGWSRVQSGPSANPDAMVFT